MLKYILYIFILTVTAVIIVDLYLDVKELKKFKGNIVGDLFINFLEFGNLEENERKIKMEEKQNKKLEELKKLKNNIKFGVYSTFFLVSVWIVVILNVLGVI